MVLREQFADGAVLPFGAGAVVAPDIEDDGVLALPGLVEVVDQLADLRVHVLDEAGEDFHQPQLKGAFGFRNAVPRRHGLGARRQFGIGRNPAELLLAREDSFAELVPAVVELAFVLVGPFLEDVVRPMDAAGRPVHEERFVRREGAMLLQPGDRLVGHVLGEVIFLVVRRLDRRGVLDEPRLPLRGLAGEEAVEVIEAVTRSANR